MMYSAPQAKHSPTVTWTTEWPYVNVFPDHITIEVAHEHLVEAFRRAECLWTPNAANHGYAWMVEREDDWAARPGVNTVEPRCFQSDPPWVAPC